MKKTLILLALSFLTTKSFTQTITKQEKGYFNLTEIGAFAGNNTYEFQTGPNSFKEVKDGAYAFNIRNINGYFITSKIALGIGVGLENYTRSENTFDSNNLFLLFFDARYYFNDDDNTFFAYGDIGSAVKITTDFDKGPMYNLGMGYKFKVAEKSALTVGLGYADQSIKHTGDNVYRDRYYGFAFKAGILF
ncbi:MAG: hypothetical protein EOO87_20410 [Pedobacter sp.]|nr:MAG: hypothetical protein EOO87_20410 [Pedobacter sp.]